jgi:hypothetical protein
VSDTKGTHQFLNDFLVPSSPEKEEKAAEEEQQDSRKRNRSAWAFIDMLEKSDD